MMMMAATQEDHVEEQIQTTAKDATIAVNSITDNQCVDMTIKSYVPHATDMVIKVDYVTITEHRNMATKKQPQRQLLIKTV